MNKDMNGFEADGSKKRIAHKGASSSTELIRDLAFKKQSMGNMVSALASNSKKRQSVSSKAKPSALFSNAIKRVKTNNNFNKSDDEDEEKELTKINSFRGTTFGNSLRKSVKNDQNSGSDGDDWLSKPRLANGTSKSGINFPPAPKVTSNFAVKKRAIIYSSGSEEGSLSMVFEELDTKRKDKSKKKVKSSFGTRTFSKKTLNSSSNDSFVTDEEEILDTPESSEMSSSENEKSDLDQKVTLKEIKKKAKKLNAREKRKKKKGLVASSEDDENNDKLDLNNAQMDSDDEEDRSQSFDSEDSDANERRQKKTLKSESALNAQCLNLCNNLDYNLEELKEQSGTKFNDRLAAFIIEKRPFDSYENLINSCNNIPRGTAMINQYLEYLENRSILDKVMDECKKYSAQIKAELENSSKEKLQIQPELLNRACVLHPYQQIGLQWLIIMNKLGLNAILADEMGLGKTIQIIAFLAWAKNQPKIKGPHLIVVPASTIENWMNELQKWCPALRVITYYGTLEERKIIRKTASSRNVDIVLSTYNMVISKAEDRSFFKRFRLNYVIYDEGHMLRSCNTIRYTNLMRIQGQKKILLTGTPLQNNLVELISLLFFAMSKMFTRYCEDIKTLLALFVQRGAVLKNKPATKKRGKKIKEAEEDLDDKELEVLTNTPMSEEDGPMYAKHKISQAKSILQPFVLRRLKSEVLKLLPKKHEKIIYCEPSDIQEELYSEVIEELQDQKGNSEGNGLSWIMQMRQVSNHSLLYRRIYNDDKVREIARMLCCREKQYKMKNPEHVAEDLAYQTDISINSLCKKFHCLKPFILDKNLALDSGKCKQLDIMLPEILNKGEKVLIFSQFTSLLDILEIYLDCRDYKFFRLDGSTPVMERQELITKFNENYDNISIFLLSTKAGGLGINLTSANHIIIHDIDMNPYNDKQAEDRAHRMGQTKEVFVTKLITKNTIEESILALAQKKLALEKDVTSSQGLEERVDSRIVEELLNQALVKHKQSPNKKAVS